MEVRVNPSYVVVRFGKLNFLYKRIELGNVA
jgi:hypothetical protein